MNKQEKRGLSRQSVPFVRDVLEALHFLHLFAQYYGFFSEVLANVNTTTLFARAFKSSCAHSVLVAPVV